MNIFHGFVRVSRSGWRHILDVWVWVDIFYVLVGVGGGILWVGGGGWTFLWAIEGEWKYI